MCRASNEVRRPDAERPRRRLRHRQHRQLLRGGEPGPGRQRRRRPRRRVPGRRRQRRRRWTRRTTAARSPNPGQERTRTARDTATPVSSSDSEAARRRASTPRTTAGARCEPGPGQQRPRRGRATSATRTTTTTALLDDRVDNCPLNAPTRTRPTRDGDGIGDACDPDFSIIGPAIVDRADDTRSRHGRRPHARRRSRSSWPRVQRAARRARRHGRRACVARRRAR